MDMFAIGWAAARRLGHDGGWRYRGAAVQGRAGRGFRLCVIDDHTGERVPAPESPTALHPVDAEFSPAMTPAQIHAEITRAATFVARQFGMDTLQFVPRSPEGLPSLAAQDTR